MERDIVEANRTSDDAMQCFFQVVYYVGKELIPFDKFLGFCALLIRMRTNCLSGYIMTKIYMQNYYLTFRLLCKRRC